MSQKSYEVFQAVENKANLLAGYWDNFKTEIIQHLPESYHAEIHELSNNLTTALETLIDELCHPTLILATTGTTSSGKSTLVNFLCGADIVPTAVSEMSAGAVTIEYNHEKGLIIEETPGALWECGWWRNISDEEICKRLEQAMHSYIDNKKDQSNLAYPKFIIYYPFRLFKEYERDLPRGVRVKLLDLPGLSYVGDDSNMEVIKQCRDALCLVTYNSQETDPQKVKSLLSQVVEQVKQLGGSPERMLFILNKIDVFRYDKNWTESERRFVEKTTTSIKHELRKQLTEYTQEIDNLKIIKLSTLPALLALQIQSNDQNVSTIACRDADRKCSHLIEESILEDLPRKAENWSSQDKIRVAEDLWQKSYAEEFQQYLNLHITQHFPKLVIPQAIDRFNVTAANSIAQWAVQTTTAILNSSEEDYQKECENIDNIKKRLEQFIENKTSTLMSSFEEIKEKITEAINNKSEEDSVLFLEKKLKELQTIEPYNQLGEKLYPLYGWRRALSQGIRDILEAIAKSLDTGKVALEHPNFKRVDISQVNSLEYQLRQLIKLGYIGSVAIKGERKEAKSAKDKEKLQEIRAALEQLSRIINPIVQKVLEQIYAQEIERMNQAMNELLQCYLSDLEEGVNERAPNIIIQFTEEKLNQVKLNLTFTSTFKSDFAITSEKYRSFSHWLWIIQGESHIAEIPSTEDLLKSWDKHLKTIEPEIFSPTAGGMYELIDELNKKVRKINNEAIKHYQDRLDKARQEITFDYDKKKTIWEPMQQKSKTLAEKFFTLKDF